MQMQDAFDDGIRTAPPRDVFTVSRLNREVRVLLERGLGTIWLEGEVSNLSRPGSGHWYFSLKDESAQVRCAMFRARNQLLRFALREGLHVLARGRVGLYEPRGEFQVVVDHLEEAGEGLLRRRFEELKQQLLAEGLFDARHKRPLPVLPRRIGVITSPTGAAIRDILQVLRRRFPAIPVLVYPVPVQGEAAPRAIAEALSLAGRRQDCDVLILARGGGSLEDLWAFNEQIVARALFDCPIPVVTGVGHEVDFTIADFVADERAPTPSAAAERAVPDCADWIRRLATLERRAVTAGHRRLAEATRRLQWQSQRLQRTHPGAKLRQHAQRLDELENRLRLAARNRLANAASRVRASRDLLLRASPQTRLRAAQLRLATARTALAGGARNRLADSSRRFELAARALHAVSPLATLDRGYAIVTDETGALLRDSAAVRRGSRVRARLARGALLATVEAIEPPRDDEDGRP